MEYEWSVSLGDQAREILSSMEETPWNREILESWREVAVTENFRMIYETPDESCYI